MDTLNELFPNLVKYLELMPVFCAGLCAGVANWANHNDGSGGGRLANTIKVILTSAFISVMCYAILSATELDYLAKVGFSTAVGYFGIDRALELVNKILSVRNFRPPDYKEYRKPEDREKDERP